jgi:hypothetical protein
MSRGQAGSERYGDTQEFELIRPAEPVIERTEFELHGHQRVPVRVDFREPIELRLGRDEQTPTCYLIRYPSHFDRKDSFAIIQPDTVRRYPGRGWIEPKCDLIKLGREVSPRFEFGPDVSRMHCLVAETDTREGETAKAIEIENYGRNGLRVLAHPDDLMGDAEPFMPDEFSRSPDW